MPIGCSSLIPYVYDELVARSVRSVLDLGVGMGLHGAGVRQWLDLGVRPWRTRLVGVEGFEAYRNPCWELYDELHVATIEDWLAESCEVFDAVLLLDVLEHFDEPGGGRVIEAARRRLAPSGIILIGTPGIWYPQGAAHGNALEVHKHLWSARALEELGFAIRWDGRPNRSGHRMIFSVGGER